MVRVTERYVGPARFNEAAALLPRKAQSTNPQSLFNFRFNEAAALLPRKARWWWRCKAKGRICFNEAAALLPRKAV